MTALRNLLRDLRQALRSLRRSPGYAAVGIVTLALGIGASTAVYTLIDRVILDPLPYPGAERLLRLKSAVPGAGEGIEWDVSEGAWWFFGREAATLETLAAYRRGASTMQGTDGPRRVQVATVTAGALPLFGARPAVGRMLGDADDDPGAPAVAVLSHAFWMASFGGDEAVVGRTVDLDERPVEIVGVLQPGVQLPPEYGVPAHMAGTDLWMPLQLDPAGPFWNSHMQFRTIARLRAGATIEEAQAELDALTSRLPSAVPNAYSPGFMERYGFRTVAYPLKEYALGDLPENLWMLFGAVGIVLLIACANVANLFLVRIESRRREAAIRAALGAGRVGLARHFLAEALALASAGGVLGLLLAVAGMNWLVALAPDGVPRLDSVRPDGSAAAFALALVIAVSVALSAIPALRHGRLIGSAALTEGRGTSPGRDRQWIRGALLTTQVALALVLVVGAALLLESMLRLRAVDVGFDPEGVVVASVHLPWVRYDDPGKMARLYDAVLERIRAVPGVEAAGFTGSIPLRGDFGCTVQGFDDAAVKQRIDEEGGTFCAGQSPIMPGYFEALDIPVLRGRGLEQEDIDAPERGSVVVSRAFAERFWPGENPIGKGVSPGGRGEPYYRVVGVVGDVPAAGPADAPVLAIYYPVAPIPDASSYWPSSLNLVVETSLADPMRIVPSLERAIAEIDPGIPLADPRAMRVIVDASMSRLTFSMVLLGIAAITALLLAAVGVYGVISYGVARRRGEIGVRMALGAERGEVEALVVRESLRLTAIGLVTGVLCALATTRFLASLLYGVEPTHPATYALAIALLAAVAAIAAWLPARRAASTDPAVVLRSE